MQKIEQRKMMKNLIINGIDHSKFDLEWAKRGGVIFDAVYEQIYIFVNKIDEEQIRLVYSSRLRGEIDFLSKSLISSLRMATPAECADAGVEYIGPPMMWRPIDTLTTDIPTPLFVCDEKSKKIGTLTGQNIFGGACIIGWDDHDTKPTHWMPKPQPPKDE